MTREERLKSCKICKHQCFDKFIGLKCSLTNEHASFEGECKDFITDEKLMAERTQLEQEQTNIILQASSTKRVVNHLLDTGFYYLFTYLFLSFIGILIGLFFPNLTETIDFENKALSYTLSAICFIIYYTTLEATTGRSLAKYITKTKVVGLDGESPNIGTIIKRSFCRFIPFDTLSFLASDGTGWHDSISGTYVVDVKKKA